MLTVLINFHIVQLRNGGEVKLMQEVDFYDTQNPRKLLTRVRLFFKRARIDKMEANIFRGLFSAVQKNLRK